MISITTVRQRVFSYSLRCIAALMLLIACFLFLPLAQAEAPVDEIMVNTESPANTETPVNKTMVVDSATLLDEPSADVSEQLIEPQESLNALQDVDNPILQNELDEPESDTGISILPHDLSAWGMFMAADWVVKAVMISLALASLLTWTALVSKTIELSTLKRQLLRNLRQVNAAHTLADAANSSDTHGVGRELIEAAEAELHLSCDMLSKDTDEMPGKEGIKERVASSLSRIESACYRRMLVGTGLLATIGAVAPFVGLFGTVWGIMNSFIGISEAQTTNLAVVAPGIAEALLATAMGLVAAIPAVVIYNHFTRRIASAKALISDITAGIMRLVSRDLDRGVSLSVVTTKKSTKVVE